MERDKTVEPSNALRVRPIRFEGRRRVGAGTQNVTSFAHRTYRFWFQSMDIKRNQGASKNRNYATNLKYLFLAHVSRRDYNIDGKDMKNGHR